MARGYRHQRHGQRFHRRHEQQSCSCTLPRTLEHKSKRVSITVRVSSHNKISIAERGSKRDAIGISNSVFFSVAKCVEYSNSDDHVNVVSVAKQFGLAHDRFKYDNDAVNFNVALFDINKYKLSFCDAKPNGVCFNNL